MIDRNEAKLFEKKDIEKVGFGIAMFGMNWIYAILIQNYLNISPMLKTIIGLVSL